jgi:peroxiredoxin Q/BCP
VLGVSFDSQEDNAKFARKYHFPFPLLCDTERKIGLAYGAATSPSDEYAKRIAYVIDENGRVIQAHEKVNAATYPHEQLEQLLRM